MISRSGATPSRDQNLPAQPTLLIGREHERRTLLQQLRSVDVHLMTLWGPAGVGKTRLALALANDLLEDFPEGCWFVDLARVTDPELVPAVIAQALEVYESPGRPPLDGLMQRLRGRHLLLVLDNFEQVLPSAGRIADLLSAAAELKILLTSREPLHLRWERTFAVAPLPLPDLRQRLDRDALAMIPAVALFVERAQAADADFRLTQANMDAVAQVCVRLDGLPLAIELAAARSNVLSPQDILARLEHRLPLLRWGAKDLPARHQTLRSAIDWSHDLLTPEDQAFLRRLGVCAGGCTIEAAQSIADADELGLDALDGLSSLVDKSLIQVAHRPDGGPRFRFLETIREYALERLEASGEAAATRRRHAEFFLQLAERADAEITGANQAVWLDRLEAEHDNFRAALAWSPEKPPSTGGVAPGETTEPSSLEIGARIAGVVAWFWRARGHAYEGRRWLDSMLEAAEAGGAVWGWTLIKALTEAGLLAITQHDWSSADQRFGQALARADALGDVRGRAWALHGLGRLAAVQGDRERAIPFFEQSMLLADQAGDAYIYRSSVLFMGTMERYSGNLQRATALYDRSLELCRAAGDVWGAAFTLFHAGHIAWARGDLGRSAGHFAEALGLFRTLRSPWGIVDCLDGLAMIVAHKQPNLSARLGGAAAAVREVVGHPPLPGDRAVYDRHRDALRRTLGEPEFEAAWSAGQTLPLDRAIDEALASIAAVSAETVESAVSASRRRVQPVLSAREYEVLELVAQGLSNKQIAESLVITEPTAKFHVGSILNKLGADNRAQAVALAVQRGILNVSRAAASQ